jgi:hypothetical protein
MPGDDSEPLEEALVDAAKAPAGIGKKYQGQREIRLFFDPLRYDPLAAKSPTLKDYVPPPANVHKDRVVLPRTAPKPPPEPRRAHPADPDDSEAQAKPKLPPEL